MSLRTLRPRGRSVGLTLSVEVVRALGLKPGDQLLEVLTAEGTVELQPPIPPTMAAAARRRAAARVRDLAEQNRRLRARLQKARQKGYAEGVAHGFAKAWTDLLLELGIRAEELKGVLTTLGPLVALARGVSPEEVTGLLSGLRALVRRAHRRPGKMLEAPGSGGSPRPACPRALAQPPALPPAPPVRSPLHPPPPSP